MEVTNRFKQLDLLDRVPEELWMEIGDTVHEAVIKTILKKKKCKKAKWLSEKALQIAEEKKKKRQRRRGKIHPSECRVPKIARRDKTAFLSDQCKETGRQMGKIRDLFKKIRDTKGTFHGKMDTIKDRNGRDQTEAEDTKKRWQEYP